MVVIRETINMEKEKQQKPEVIIESAEPVSDYSSGTSDSESEVMTQKRPSRINAINAHVQKGYVPKGMRPVNSFDYEVEEYGDVDYKTNEKAQTLQEKRAALSLTHPMVLVAASLGIGILISYFGVGLLKPAVEKVVEAAEEIADEQSA